MRMEKRTGVSVLVWLVGAGAWAGTVFQDTFNSTPSTDINTEIAARQAGGFLSADYTGAMRWYGVDGTRLVQTGGGEIVQPVHLAAYVAGGTFTLSFKQDLDLTNENWSSVYLASATEYERRNSRVGFHAWGTGNGVAFTLYSGTGVAGAAYTEIHITGAQMDTLWQSRFGVNFDRLAEHTLQFVSTAGAGGTNTYDFVVDNVIVANDVVYAFRDDTVRNIRMVSTLTNDAGDADQVFYDDLTVTSPIPEPMTVGSAGFRHRADSARPPLYKTLRARPVQLTRAFCCPACIGNAGGEL